MEYVDALTIAKSEYEWVKLSLFEARKEIETLKAELKQLRTCKDFKKSHSSRLLDENKALRQQVTEMEQDLERYEQHL